MKKISLLLAQLLFGNILARVSEESFADGRQKGYEEGFERGRIYESVVSTIDDQQDFYPGLSDREAEEMNQQEYEYHGYMEEQDRLFESPSIAIMTLVRPTILPGWWFHMEDRNGIYTCVSTSEEGIEYTIKRTGYEGKTMWCDWDNFKCLHGSFREQTTKTEQGV